MRESNTSGRNIKVVVTPTLEDAPGPELIGSLPHTADAYRKEARRLFGSCRSVFVEHMRLFSDFGFYMGDKEANTINDAFNAIRAALDGGQIVFREAQHIAKLQQCGAATARSDATLQSVLSRASAAASRKGRAAHG